MARALLALTLVLASLSGRAADEIEGPTAIPVYHLATVRTSLDADGFLWFVFPMESSFEAMQADPKIFQFTGAPGTHQVFLVPLVAGKMTGKFRKDIVIGDGFIPPPGPGPGPAPGPGPSPTPDPIPVPPVTETLHVTLVYDIDASNPATATIRTDPALRIVAEQARVIWRSYDDNSPTVAEKNLMPFVKKAGGVPALIIQSIDGRVLGAVPCPPTAAGVADVIRSYRKAG